MSLLPGGQSCNQQKRAVLRILAAPAADGRVRTLHCCNESRVGAKRGACRCIQEPMAPPVRRLHVDPQAARTAEEAGTKVRCTGGAGLRSCRSDDHGFFSRRNHSGDSGDADRWDHEHLAALPMARQDYPSNEQRHTVRPQPSKRRTADAPWSGGSTGLLQ